MQLSRDYEQDLIAYMIESVLKIQGVRFFGIRDLNHLEERVPTIAIRYKDEHPHDTATRLGKAGICVWDGNYYAINLSERLGVEQAGGMVRIGLSHYNTREEVDRFLNALES